VGHSTSSARLETATARRYAWHAWWAADDATTNWASRTSASRSACCLCCREQARQPLRGGAAKPATGPPATRALRGKRDGSQPICSLDGANPERRGEHAAAESWRTTTRRTERATDVGLATAWRTDCSWGCSRTATAHAASDHATTACATTACAAAWTKARASTAARAATTAHTAANHYASTTYAAARLSASCRSATSSAAADHSATGHAATSHAASAGDAATRLAAIGGANTGHASPCTGCCSHQCNCRNQPCHWRQDAPTTRSRAATDRCPSS